jgi:hypothetical protein
MSSAGPPKAASISLPDVLARLDSDFSEFALAVAQDQYALWLGSGISFDQMPSLQLLIRKILTHLQAQADLAEEACPLHVSLKAILAMANLGKDEIARTDIKQPPVAWPDIDIITARLAARYGEVLDQNPAGQLDDYLLWEGVKVTDVYSDPTIEPGAEHFGVAALAIEGTSSKIASANWDSLVEKAVAELNGSTPILRVIILPEHTQEAELRSSINKFHGCAKAAKEQPAIYREKLVARKTQIDGWVDNNKVLADKLIDLARSKRTLMLGLSAQDTNIQNIFIKAKNQMQWTWPSSPPAYVFAEDKVQPNQKGLLKNVYRAYYSPANEEAILASALMPAFAAPLLISLWLKIIELKLSLMVSTHAGLSVPHQDLIRSGLRKLRDSAASHCAAGTRLTFLKAAFKRAQILLTEFRGGVRPKAGDPGYTALSALPYHQIQGDPHLQPSGLIGLSIALGLVGVGEIRGHWQARIPDNGTVRSGSIELVGSGRTVQVFFADGGHSAARIIGSLAHDNDDALVIVSHEIAAPMQRTSSPMLGRTGTPECQKVSMAQILASSTDPDINLRAIRESIGL